MKKAVKFWFFLFCSLLIFSQSCRQQSYRDEVDVKKSAASRKGMVVTAHPLASEVGLDILRQGGNAADAAIAVQFALAVVYPRAGNIGGGGFLVYRESNGRVTSLDFREKAPMLAHRDMYLDSNGNVINGLSMKGMLAAGVPGTVAGMVETHKKYGKLPWQKLLEPAIQLAETGFHITKLESQRLNTYRDDFISLNPPDMPFLSAKPWKKGDLLVQKELAATLREIAKQGRDGFYSGINADQLEALSKAKKGLLTKADLHEYQPLWRVPQATHWRSYTLYTMGLPSSGGIVMNQILGMIENRLIDSLGYRHPRNVHLLIEAERRAFADRAMYLGDADFYPVPVDSLLDQQYIQSRMNDFDPEKATPSKSIHSSPIVLHKEHFETTHTSVTDEEGNAVSVTTTLNDNYGCRIWVPGGGYFLNNEMDDFSVKPGVPNLFGLIGGEANAISPGKRMLSTMSPTIIEKDGRLWMTLGSPGGPTIITSIIQVFLNTASFRMNIDEAVQAERYHHQWLPDEIMCEKDAFTPELTKALEQMGYTFSYKEYIGLVEAILVDDQGIMHGAADHRGDDHAAGW